MGFTDTVRSYVATPSSISEEVIHDALQALPPEDEQETKDEAKKRTAAAVQDQPGDVAFVTTESLLTFSGSTTAVVVIWRVIQALAPTSEALKSTIVPLVLAFLLGAFLLSLDLIAKRKTPLSNQEKIKKFGIAIINAFFLTAAVVGIDTTIA